MANHHVPMLSWSTLPDTRLTTGNVTPEPTNINLNSNDRYRRLCFRFANTATKDGLTGSFRVPENYVGTAKVVIRDATPTTTGDRKWIFEYTAIAAGESADPSADQEAVSITQAVSGSARFEQEMEIALTSANFAAGDLVEWILSRDGAGADTLADNLYLLGLWLKYADA